jgi:hypothetical protein
MVKQCSFNHVVTLEEILSRFASWRSKPVKPRRIPEELWNAAVSLCGQHSICKVSRLLRLDYKALRSRCQSSEVTQGSQPFVELGTLWPQTEVFVECDNGTRQRMRIHCKGPVDTGIAGLVKSFFECRR